MIGALMLGVGYVVAAQATGALAVHARPGAADRHARQLPPPSGRWSPTSRTGSCSRRGIAVAIVASGNYLAGTIWPPILQHAIDACRLAPGPSSASALFCVAHHAAARAAACAGGAPVDDGTRADQRARHARTRCACRRRRCRRCWCSPASPAASRCRCRRCTSSPIAPTSATARRAAPRCSR